MTRSNLVSQSDMSSLWDTASQLLDAQHFENVEALKAKQRDSLRDRTNHLNCSIDDFKSRHNDPPPLNEIEAGPNMDSTKMFSHPEYSDHDDGDGNNSDDNFDDNTKQGEEEWDYRRKQNDTSDKYAVTSDNNKKDRRRSKSLCSHRTGISTRTAKVDNRQGVQVWQNKELVAAGTDDRLSTEKNSVKPAPSLQEESALACIPDIFEETFGSASKDPKKKKNKHNSLCGVRLV